MFYTGLRSIGLCNSVVNIQEEHRYWSQFTRDSHRKLEISHVCATVEHISFLKNAMSRCGSIPGPLTLQATPLTTQIKEISPNTVSLGGYELMVPI